MTAMKEDRTAQLALNDMATIWSWLLIWRSFKNLVAIDNPILDEKIRRFFFQAMVKVTFNQHQWKEYFYAIEKYSEVSF